MDISESDFLKQKPLWIVFPEMKPNNLSDTQGYYELVNISWADFWMPLTREQMEAYLAHWQAPIEWGEALLFLKEMEEIDT